MDTKRCSALALAAEMVVALVALAPRALGQTAGPGASATVPGLADLFRPPEGRYHRITSSHQDVNSNLDYLPIAAGAEVTIARISGAGIIRHLWLTAESDDPYYARMLVLRARWDGETSPSVEAPIGDFFAVGNAQEAPVDTLPIRVAGDGRARVSWWPMPFNKGAELSIRNDSNRPARLTFWQVDWFDAPPCPNLRTFHAQFRATPRQGALRQHRVAEILGRGHYVGTVLSIWSGEAGWPGEGDDRFFVDLSETATFIGSGFESAFDDAWGFRVGMGPFGGVTSFEGTGSGARTTACRWHVLDPVAFEKGLGVTFERQGYAQRNGAWQLTGDRRDAWSSVAFWYQEEPHATFSALPSPQERLPFAELRLEPEEDDLFELLQVPDEVTPPVVESGPFWAYGAQVRFVPTKQDDAVLSLPFEIGAARDYDLYLRLTRTPDGGCWQTYVDGLPVGAPIDCYATRSQLREPLVATVALERGPHVLELRATGKQLESTGLALGLDSVMIRWYP